MNLEQKGKNIVDIQRMNRTLVLKTIRDKKITTRTEISEQTGLNKATVTNIVSDLISWGVTREKGLVIGKAGRRSIAIELAAERYGIISVWLTRRHLHIGIFDFWGESENIKTFPIGIKSPIDELIEEICQHIENLIEQVKNKKRILGIAVALPGPYIKKDHKIVLLTDRPDWQNVDIAARLAERFDYDIFTEHDVNAAVMAEWSLVNHFENKASIMCIMVGQGVGSGIIEEGKLVHGQLGVAGEIGHMSICYNGELCKCGNRGCLENYCSTLAIQKKVHKQSKDHPDSMCNETSSVGDIIRAYKADDVLAGKIIDEAAQALGYGIISAINMLNPGKIIIGDELSHAGERFLRIVKETVKERIIPEIYSNVEITLSSLSDSVLKGVSVAYTEEIMKNPEIFEE